MTDASRDRVAPPTFLPCPRCGSSTFTRQDVQKHDAWHAKQDTRDRKLDGLLERLGGFLDAADAIDTADGEPMKFAEWIDYVGTTLDELRESKGTGGGFVLEQGEWPTVEDATEGEPDEDVVPLIPGTDIPDVTGLIDDEDDDADSVSLPLHPDRRF